MTFRYLDRPWNCVLLSPERAVCPTLTPSCFSVSSLHAVFTCVAGKTYRLIYQLWRHMCEPRPDLKQIQKFSECLQVAVDEAEHHYQTCLRLNPESISSLRAYAQFLSNVKGDQDRSTEFLNKADRIEEAVSRMRSRHVSRFCFDQRMTDVEFADETSAVVTIRCVSLAGIVLCLLDTVGFPGL